MNSGNREQGAERPAVPAVLAHSRNGIGARQGLEDHLRAVATQAAAFCRSFGAAEPAWYAGLWHDIGKWNPVFQAYLADCEAHPTGHVRGPDHKGAGAVLASNHLLEAALLIQGHHGGLRAPADCKAWLFERAADPAVQEALVQARGAIPDLEPGSPIALPPALTRSMLAADLFIRMVFSALVDADFLDTERHFQVERSAQRTPGLELSELWRRFQLSHARLPVREGSAVDRVRAEVYEACLKAADLPPGLFRLAVPTGGGKTLSAMAFALAHALRHGQRRVIVALPFITITEQTADVYRLAFNDEAGSAGAVLEHHSAAAGAADDDDAHPAELWRRLAAENWDAPVIVTTTVQLFESLFACRTTPCRKVHRLANAVIVLDEAQALPPSLLTPILHALRCLCTDFGTSVVVSTATQPAFDAIKVFSDLPATDIVAEPHRHFRALSRVSYEWRTDQPRPLSEIAELLRGEDRALAVLNTRRDALALLDELHDSDALHLSTLLCGAHRREVLAAARRRLSAGEGCRLVSTQVIEAGVDLDFPLVARALGPLDAIIQSAGRCNREGRLERGRVVVFDAEDARLPKGVYEQATHVTQTMLARGDLDLDDPAVARAYFAFLFETVDSDRHRIQELRARANFPEVAERFRMIEDDTEAVVVGYGSQQARDLVDAAVDRLRAGAPETRLLLRRLQPYLVTLRRHEADRHRRSGLIEPLIPGVGRWLGDYDAVRGLWGGDIRPDDLVW